MVDILPILNATELVLVRRGVDPAPFEYCIMYFVYILKSEYNQSLYIGRTTNLTRRIKERNSGENPSTKRYMPWVCVYFEGYFSEENAKTREKNLKIFGKAYGQLKGRIKNSLQMSN